MKKIAKGKTVKPSISLPEEAYIQARERAASYGDSFSGWVRRLIYRELLGMKGIKDSLVDEARRDIKK